MQRNARSASRMRNRRLPSLPSAPSPANSPASTACSGVGKSGSADVEGRDAGANIKSRLLKGGFLLPSFSFFFFPRASSPPFEALLRRIILKFYDLIPVILRHYLRLIFSNCVTVSSSPCPPARPSSPAQTPPRSHPPAPRSASRRPSLPSCRSAPPPQRPRPTAAIAASASAPRCCARTRPATWSMCPAQTSRMRRIPWARVPSAWPLAQR